MRISIYTLQNEPTCSLDLIYINIVRERRNAALRHTTPKLGRAQARVGVLMGDVLGEVLGVWARCRLDRVTSYVCDISNV